MLLNSYWSGGWTGYMTRRRASRANVLMNPYPAPSSTAISIPFERCSPRALRMQALAGEGPGLITRRGNAAMTPLHWAVRGNALSCAEWLLSKGADVDAETEAHRTPMHRAAEWNLGEMMWLLADCGARLDPADSKERTPLHRATYIGQVETAEILIVLGADPDRRNNRGKTPLDIARKDCVYLR